MDNYELGSCSHCGRNDVPICPKCHQRVPHGFISGTWLPCSCGGMSQGLNLTDHLIERTTENAKLESASYHGKEVKT